MSDNYRINQYYCATMNDLGYRLDLGHALVLSIVDRYDIVSNYQIYDEMMLFKGELKAKRTRIDYLVTIKIIREVEKSCDVNVLKQLIDKDNGIYKDFGCVVCGVDDIPLDKHHYPIRAKDDGKKTIDLCPNCHRRFHQAADYIKHYEFVEMEKIKWNLNK